MSKNMNKIHVLEYMEIENVLPITETKKNVGCANSVIYMKLRMNLTFFFNAKL